MSSLLDDYRTQLDGYRLYAGDRRKADWNRMKYESTLGSAQEPGLLVTYDFDAARAL